jgi:hypothetical protein
MAKQRRKRGTAGDKTICLPLADDLDYATLVADREAFRQYLDQQIAAHPELFLVPPHFVSVTVGPCPREPTQNKLELELNIHRVGDTPTQ